MKYNISISVDEKFSEMIDKIKDEAELKGQSFSYSVLSAIQKSREKKSSGLSLDSDFQEVQKFAREMDVEELKEISHKAHVITLTLEAFIKWDSYEGKKKDKQFPNPRECERYLRK